MDKDTCQEDVVLLTSAVGVRSHLETLRGSSLFAYCVEFIKSFDNDGIPPNAIYDVSVQNRLMLYQNSRLHQFRRTGPTLFSLIPPVGIAQAPWRITVCNARDVLLICQLDPQLSEFNICRILIQRGITFHTLMSQPTILQTPTPSPIIPVRTVSYKFTKTDYQAYVEERRALLRSSRVRRATIMSGGILWRLAVSDVSHHEIFDGPTAAAALRGVGTVLKGETMDTVYCDDSLSNAESDTLCGLVYRETGKSIFRLYNTMLTVISQGRGKQRESLSWWPCQQLWKRDISHTSWNESLEHIFAKRLKQLEDGQDPQPLNASQW